MNVSHLQGKRHIEVTPSISLAVGAKFKTHGHIFDNIRGKALDDKTIFKYEQQGYYDGVRRDINTNPAKPKRKSTTKLAPKLSKEQVMKELGL